MLDMLSRPFDAARIALALRVGLGSVFLIGGLFKLSRLLDPAASDGLVAKYVSPAGYINTFFQEVLFAGPLGEVLTPWGFLAALSTFELVSGLALIAGFLVRPLALVYGFLLWTFIAALPVTVSPGATAADPTYLSPALLVQIRDIGLSGLMFVLVGLGAGAVSVDRWLFGENDPAGIEDWQGLGLLTRLSLAGPLLIGGLFAGMDHIQSWGLWPPLLILTGAVLVLGAGGVRIAGAVAAAAMAWFIVGKIDPGASLIVNLNGFKRELAFLAAGGVLAVFGGGSRYTLADLRDRAVLAAAMLRAKRDARRGVPQGR
jgi:uncharacterized membrane protein YphA (DoxX/SURF4 family)